MSQRGCSQSQPCSSHVSGRHAYNVIFNSWNSSGEWSECWLVKSQSPTRTDGVWTALHLRCSESLLQAHVHKHVEPLPAGLRAPACSFQIWYRYEVTLFVQSSVF